MLKRHAILFRAATPNDHRHNCHPVDNAYEAFVLDDGESLIEDRVGLTYIVAPTGRTVRVWGIDCPTFLLHDVETIADADGVIRGVKGERLVYTMATRPENITTTQEAS
jgi:hypothetical protein